AAAAGRAGRSLPGAGETRRSAWRWRDLEANEPPSSRASPATTWPTRANGERAGAAAVSAAVAVAGEDADSDAEAGMLSFPGSGAGRAFVASPLFGFSVGRGAA
ncbi:MAG: hypothetical protein KIT17_13570, partial [Rubrivivax sp.]|nr:hypothetical protein [Rubrivivax sp.]